MDVGGTMMLPVGSRILPGQPTNRLLTQIPVQQNIPQSMPSSETSSVASSIRVNIYPPNTQQPPMPAQPISKQAQFAQQVRQQIAANQGMLFDGKRMRKSVQRKVVDYNSSVFNYMKTRIWQRDLRDARAIQPDSLYHINVEPPLSMLHNPMNAVTTKFVRQSTNKFRCPIFVLTWTPEGRRLVTGASSGEFTLWNGLSFNFETILQAHDVSVRAMRWSHNDLWMVTADHAGFIKYWQSNMNNVNMYQGHKEAVRGIRWALNMDQILSLFQPFGLILVLEFGYFDICLVCMYVLLYIMSTYIINKAVPSPKVINIKARPLLHPSVPP